MLEVVYIVGAFGLVLLTPPNFAVAGLLIAILMGLEYGVLWVLTGESLNRELILVILNIVYSIVWSITALPFTPIYYILQPSFSQLLIIYLYLALFIGSILLGAIPVIMYIRKYLKFNKILKEFKKSELDYKSINQKYSEINTRLNKAKEEIKNIINEINKAKELYETALKDPDLIITALDKKPQIPEVIRPNVNYVVVGLGGTGTALLEAFIDYLVSKNTIKEDGINPFLFVAFDTNEASIVRLREKYKNTPVAKLLYTFNNFEALTTANIINHNPWLAGLSVSIIQGSGTKRAIGYAAYNTVKNAMMEDILSRLNDLIAKTKTNRIFLIVFTALGGGTGSGSFIHFTKDFISRLGRITGDSEPYVMGFGVLPRENEGMLYHVNAFAAIKEMQFILKYGARLKDEKASRGAENTINVINPFLAFFLISRDRPDKNVDTNIALGLARFISDIGTSGVVQENQSRYTETFDLSDIRTAAAMSPYSFFTFNRYDIYFPASRLSWYKNVGVIVFKDINDRYTKLREEVDEISRLLSEYKDNTSKFLANLDNLSNTVKSMTIKVYRRWSNRIGEVYVELLKWRENVVDGGSISPKNLETLLNSIYSSAEENVESIVILKRRIDEFNEIVKEEELFLKAPPSSHIEYVFSVPNLENFDISQLSTEKASLYRLVNQYGRQSDFLRALADLKAPLGSVGLTMANIDYQRINVPIPVTTEAKDFISRYNPGLIKDNAVKTPDIDSVLMVTASSQDNITNNDFPNLATLKQALDTKTHNSNAKISYINSKRFSISTYHIINGVYIWRISKNTPPILKDLTYLMKNYDKVKKSNFDQLIYHHTLFYNDYQTVEALTGIQIVNLSPNQAVQKIVEYWANYDPETEYINIWGIIELSSIYSDLKIINDNIDNLMGLLDKAIKNLQRGVTNVDVVNIKKYLDAINSAKVPSPENINAIYEANKIANNTEVNRALNEIIELSLQTVSKLEEIKKYGEKWIDDLNKLKKESTDYGVNRTIQTLINYIGTLIDKSESLSKELYKFKESVNLE